MRRSYVAIIERSETPGYSVYFPDFPGCVSAGDSIEETVRMGREALAGHVAVMTTYGDPIPRPTPLDDIDVEPDIDVAALVLIDVSIPGKGRRVTVTLDETLVTEIDRLAGAGGRSAFLADAARSALARRHVDDAAE